MRFAIPTDGENLSNHFGQCEKFTIIEADGEDITSKETLAAPSHRPGELPRWLQELETNIVITNAIGSRALDHFVQNGIHVLTGAPLLTPKELVERYLDESLYSNENLCNH